MFVTWIGCGMRGGAAGWSNVSSSTLSRPPDAADTRSNSAWIQEAAPPIPSPLGSGSESVWRVLKLARTKMERWIRSAETSPTIFWMSGSRTGSGGGASAARPGAARSAAIRIGAQERMQTQ